MDELATLKEELRAAVSALASVDSRDKVGLELALGLVEILEERLRRAAREQRRDERRAAS
jgi:hypothetical protein